MTPGPLLSAGLSCVNNKHNYINLLVGFLNVTDKAELSVEAKRGRKYGAGKRWDNNFECLVLNFELPLILLLRPILFIPLDAGTPLFWNHRDTEGSESEYFYLPGDGGK